MAKRKTPKVKDLRPQNVTKEQLEKIQESVNNINRYQIEIGAIELRKHELLHGVSTIKDQLVLIQSELEKEYGTFDVDIKDGKINYPKENV